MVNDLYICLAENFARDIVLMKLTKGYKQCHHIFDENEKGNK